MASVRAMEKKSLFEKEAQEIKLALFAQSMKVNKDLDNSDDVYNDFNLKSAQISDCLSGGIGEKERNPDLNSMEAY